ncbi:MAG: hypothetical protein H0V29_08270 [Thermoleophilaceae bacterium]|nr:hypothetical protein [Thermoleophilaceae bacterium]
MLSEDERRDRRERRRQDLRRRRLGALGGLLLAIAALTAGIVVGSGGDEPSRGGGQAASGQGDGEEAKPVPPPQLPRGGRRIFPDNRVVAFYGAPNAAALGILGIGTPTRAGRKLQKVARPYVRAGRKPVLPAMELIATVASGASTGGRYSYRQPRAFMDRYLKAARRAKALLLLDVQPGRADFLKETRALRKWLREPDVGLALDPEWHVSDTQIPGKALGSVEAADINRVSKYLSGIVRQGNLPQKLLIVHQFTPGMIKNRSQLRRYPGVALVMNIDGFGNRADKIAVYRDLAPRGRKLGRGFKLFYEEDEGLMSPREVMRLRPRPDVVVYE